MSTRVRNGQSIGARSGVILLEVLIALVIVGTVGAAMASLATGAGDSVLRALRVDEEVRRASSLMESVALWPREDLDRHLGTHPQGRWMLDIERPAERLYTVVLSDSGTAKELLHTALYRPRERTPQQADHAP